MMAAVVTSTGSPWASLTTFNFEPLRIHFAPVQLKRVSLGAASSYGVNGGLPILSDDCPVERPVDLAVRGTLAPFGGRMSPLLGAFHLGFRHDLGIRLTLGRSLAGTKGIYLRARYGEEVRIAETKLDLPGQGEIEVELPVVGVRSESVGIITEEWTLECREEGQENYVSLLSGDPKERLTVRLYIVAGFPCNAAARHSFYHLGCQAQGAESAAEAQEMIWDYFMLQRGNSTITNARGQALTFWKTATPSTGTRAYTQRDAQDLIVQTDCSCFGWADLLREAFAIHGLKARVRGLRPAVPQGALDVPILQFQANGQSQKSAYHGLGFIVRHARWAAKPSIDPKNTDQVDDALYPGSFPYKINDVSNPLCVSWAQEDVEMLDSPGHLSQNSNHCGIFGNHAVTLVERNGREFWYDPSLGIGPHASLLAYQHDLLGYGQENCGGIFAIVGCRPEIKWDGVARQKQIVGLGKFFIGATKAPQFLCIEALDPAPKDVGAN